MRPALARTRPDRSFERLYRRHVGDVYRYALAVLRSRPDAEDVTRTTFVNAYRAFQSGGRPAEAQGWLITIAHSVCRQRFPQIAPASPEIAFEDEALTVEDVRRALNQLAFDERTALIMREVEGRTYAEIAEILDLSTSAVETLIFCARWALRELLETSLTCAQAQLSISRQLDGQVGRTERAALRAHLRRCANCSTFARRQRTQRKALRALASVPLPDTLSSFATPGT
jgi:RNA polymerase sigma factor (sigma-70 family)